MAGLSPASICQLGWAHNAECAERRGDDHRLRIRILYFFLEERINLNHLFASTAPSFSRDFCCCFCCAVSIFSRWKPICGADTDGPPHRLPLSPRSPRGWGQVPASGWCSLPQETSSSMGKVRDGGNRCSTISINP